MGNFFLYLIHKRPFRLWASYVDRCIEILLPANKNILTFQNQAQNNRLGHSFAMVQVIWYHIFFLRVKGAMKMQKYSSPPPTSSLMPK